MPSLEQLEAAARVVYAAMPPTPQFRWPLLEARCGTEVWVKHENHTPVGAFKVRGGLFYLSELTRTDPYVKGVISATRGNHGQSLGFAARRSSVAATIVVPHGNSAEKNAAMQALGVQLLEHGADFQDAAEHAQQLAKERKLHRIPAFHPWLVQGVASYSLEFLRAVPDLETVYVPIGQGSGICGMIAARDALGLATRIIGVVSQRLPAYALSMDSRIAVSTEPADTIADGLACRVPDPKALELIFQGVERVVTVSEERIRAAMKHYFTDTHNVAEGAGAAPLAALLQERDRMQGRRVGLVLSGGNVDRSLFSRVLEEAADGEPAVRRSSAAGAAA